MVWTIFHCWICCQSCLITSLTSDRIPPAQHLNWRISLGSTRKEAVPAHEMLGQAEVEGYVYGIKATSPTVSARPLHRPIRIDRMENSKFTRTKRNCLRRTLSQSSCTFQIMRAAQSGTGKLPWAFQRFQKASQIPCLPTNHTDNQRSNKCEGST